MSFWKWGDRWRLCDAPNAADRRGAVAEFPHRWIKGLWGRRRFLLRGLTQVTPEAKWWALSYNFAPGLRLRSPTPSVAAT